MANIRIEEHRFRVMPYSRRIKYVKLAEQLIREGMVPLTAQQLIQILTGK